MKAITHTLTAAALCLSLAGVASAADTYAEAMKEFTTHRTQKDYAAAEASLQSALKLASNNDQKAQALQHLAWVHSTQKDIPKAIQAMEEAQTLTDLPAARQASIVYSLAGYYLTNKQYDKALETNAKLAAMEDASALLRFRGLVNQASLYTNYKEMQDLPKARELLNKAINADFTTDADKAAARYQLGSLEVTGQNHAQAIKILTALQEDDKLSAADKAKYRNGLANAYRVDKQYDKAVSTYESTLKDEAAAPIYKVQAQYMLGLTHSAAKDYPKAKAAYEATIAMEGAPETYVTNSKKALERLEKLMAQ